MTSYGTGGVIGRAGPRFHPWSSGDRYTGSYECSPMDDRDPLTQSTWPSPSFMSLPRDDPRKPKLKGAVTMAWRASYDTIRDDGTYYCKLVQYQNYGCASIKQV
jgi:hypothetical protein